jgi:hypothetical protein
MVHLELLENNKSFKDFSLNLKVSLYHSKNTYV